MADQLPGKYNFGSVVSGDTISAKTITFSFDLTGYSAKLQMKSATQDTLPTIDLATGSGLTVSGNSIVIESFTAPTTDSSTTLYYDLELTGPSGNKRTYLSGTLHIVADISR